MLKNSQALKKKKNVMFGRFGEVGLFKYFSASPPVSMYVCMYVILKNKNKHPKNLLSRNPQIYQLVNSSVDVLGIEILCWNLSFS